MSKTLKTLNIADIAA